MIKILYIVSSLKKTGPIVVLANIIKFIDTDKFEPTILTLSPEPNSSMQQYFTDSLHIKVDTIGLSRIKGLFFAKKNIKKYIENNNIDLVHSHGFRADILLNGISITQVSTIHNYPFYDYIMKFGNLKGTFMAKKHFKFIKDHSTNCIACAKTIASEFHKNNLNLKYIQNGVNIQDFYPLPSKDILKIRRKLHLPNNKTIFITVGSLIPRKDMGTVISAFNIFNKDYGGILLVIGNGDEQKKLESLSTKNILFLGHIDNVVEYLQISDCFISASLAEGLPNTVLEAMACGLPTILSKISSHVEIYENKEVSFFEIKNLLQLVDMMKEITVSYTLQKNISLRLIEEKFSAKVMSEKYQKVYEEKLNESI